MELQCAVSSGGGSLWSHLEVLGWVFLKQALGRRVSHTHVLMAGSQETPSDRLEESRQGCDGVQLQPNPRGRSEVEWPWKLLCFEAEGRVLQQWSIYPPTYRAKAQTSVCEVAPMGQGQP